MRKGTVSVPTARRILFAALVALAVPAGAPASAATARRGLSPAQETALPTAPATAEAQPSEPGVIKTYTLPPEKYAQAVEYSRARYRLYFLGVLLEVAVLMLVLGGGLGPRFRDWAERLSRRRVVQALVFAPLFLLTLSVLEMPVSIRGHWLERHYDQSVQGWGSWLWDWAKGQMIGLAIGTLLIWILYGVIRRSPRRWWFYFWLASLPIILFILLIDPLVIQPLFFKFEPLARTQPALVAEIGKVVERGGLVIPPERMFEMKASEKLKSHNAYVSGFGPSKRVVVWDTTIQKMTVPQTLFVFGHEMGHYVLGHIPKVIAFTAAMLLLFLFVGFHGMRWVLGRWGGRSGIRGVEDWASLPVLWLLFTALSFLGAPVFNTYSRHLEHDADIYGLEVVHGLIADSPRVAAESFQVLGEADLSDPDPSRFIKVWLYSHPPMGERVVFAQQYDPWLKGEAPKFVK